MNLFVGSLRLLAELVAREIENLKPSVLELLVDALQLLILRRESAGRGGVDNQKNLSLVIRKRNILAFSCLNRKILYVHIVIPLSE